MNRLAAALLGGAVTTGALVALRAQPSTERWRRTNYAGRDVSLLGGLATAAGSVSGALAAGGAPGAGAAVVSATAAVLGAVDDADTTSTSKGLRGHLTALRRGEVTTGLMKLVGISGASVVAAAVAPDAGRRSAGERALPSALARTADVLASGVLIAATTNLVNLFDLRPGRALKATGVISAPLALVPGASGRLAGATLGVVAASLPSDLAEETMLGDAGANAVGALAGTALALLPSARLRMVATGAVVGLVLLSEKVSFTTVIASTPVLRDLDAWGRPG